VKIDEARELFTRTGSKLLVVEGGSSSGSSPSRTFSGDRNRSLSKDEKGAFVSVPRLVQVPM